MWSKLSDMNETECESAAELFKSGCLTLGIDNSLLDELCFIISAFPPSQVYANITSTPSFKGFQTVIENMKDALLDDGLYDACSAILPKEPVELKPSHSPMIIRSNSYEFLLLTLIDVMAGCSKIGGGSEDSIMIVPGAPALATLLFQDSFINRIQMMFKKLYKNDESSYVQLMVPLMFAHAILLPRHSNTPKSSKLPNTLEDFRQIQEQHFGSCLTEASLQSRNAYLSLLGSEEYRDNTWLCAEISAEIEEKLLEISHEVEQIIQHRIRMADEAPLHSEHLNVAIRWLIKPYKISSECLRSASSELLRSASSECLRSASITLSPIPPERYTPVSIIDTFMLGRSMSGFHLFSPSLKKSSANSNDIASDGTMEPKKIS